SGTLDVDGGMGGTGPNVINPTGDGGGGAGGRIAVVAPITYRNTGVVNLQGGASGASDPGNPDLFIPPNTFGPGIPTPDANGADGALSVLSPLSARVAHVFGPVRFTFDPRTGIYSGFVTMINLGPQDLVGPFSIAFANLPRGAVLLNATGVTSGLPDVFGGLNFFPAGMPFIVVNTTLISNTPVRIAVQFINPFHGSLGSFFGT